MPDKSAGHRVRVDLGLGHTYVGVFTKAFYSGLPVHVKRTVNGNGTLPEKLNNIRVD